MTGALLSAALAVLLWPGPGSRHRNRLAGVVGVRGRAMLPSRPRVDPALAAAAVAGGVGALGSTLLVAGLAGGAAFVLARSRRMRRAEKRSEAEIGELTEGLAVVAAELRSGRSLAAASGSDGLLAAAIQAPAAAPPRHPDPAVRSTVARVAAGAALSGRTGCSLATVLTALEDDLRARARHRMELRAATAGPRAGAAVLAGLPVLGLAMGSGVGADPWRVLTTTTTGQVLLVAGVCLELAGLEWSRRLVERARR